MLRCETARIALGGIGLLAYVSATPATAADIANSKPAYGFVFRLGLAAGGDDTGSWTRTYPSQAVIEENENRGNVIVTLNPIVERPGETAGRGMFVEAGMEFRMGPSPYSVELSVGHQSSGLFLLAGESDTEFTKQSINVVPSFHVGKHAMGVGLTYHFNPTLKSPEASYIYDYVDDQLGPLPPVAELEFDSSLGIVLQYTYGRGLFRYGVKATFIDYDSKALRTLDASYNETETGRYSRTISGNGVGLFVQMSVGKI